MANLKNTKKRDDFVYDVGLHTGEDTDFYLKKGFSVGVLYLVMTVSKLIQSLH